MRTCPVIELYLDQEKRIQRLVKEYGHFDSGEFLEAMEKIVKRLGGQHFKAAKENLLEGHMEKVMEILLTYYDKAYALGLEKKKDRLVGTLTWDGDDPVEAAIQLKNTYSPKSNSK